jgi:Flp pilus assembly protein CpaB
MKDGIMGTTFTPTPSGPAPAWGADPVGDGMRVAPLPRQRRPGLIVLALVLILASAAVITSLFLQAGNRSAVLAVARPVQAGHTIENADLMVVRISIDPALHAIGASSRRNVVGKVAVVPLVPGQLLTSPELTDGRLLDSGQGIVGVALKPGQLPAGQLQPGDRVMVVRTPRTEAAAAEEQDVGVLVASAVVRDLSEDEDADATLVALVVNQQDAPRVAAAAAAGQVGLVQLPVSP